MKRRDFLRGASAVALAATLPVPKSLAELPNMGVATTHACTATTIPTASGCIAPNTAVTELEMDYLAQELRTISGFVKRCGEPWYRYKADFAVTVEADGVNSGYKLEASPFTRVMELDSEAMVLVQTK